MSARDSPEQRWLEIQTAVRNRKAMTKMGVPTTSPVLSRKEEDPRPDGVSVGFVPCASPYGELLRFSLKMFFIRSSTTIKPKNWCGLTICADAPLFRKNPQTQLTEGLDPTSQMNFLVNRSSVFPKSTV